MKSIRLFSALCLAALCHNYALSDTRLPEVPAAMTAPEQRAAYIMTHIWDFPENLSSPEAAEQALSDFLSVAQARIAHPEDYARAVATLTDKADKAGIDILTLAAKYTSDPMAPYFDDELYLPFVDAALASPSVLNKKNGLKERLQYDRACILKNRVGTQATSFDVLSASGVTCPVTDLFTAPKNLLILFDPDCDHCREILSELSASGSLAKAVETRQVNVIAVWIDAQDSPDAISIPSAEGWNIVSDRTGIMDNELYELPVMPSVYVVDDKNTIIRKNLVDIKTIKTALDLTE